MNNAQPKLPNQVAHGLNHYLWCEPIMKSAALLKSYSWII